MFGFSSRSVFAVLAALLAGMLVLSGCAGAAPVAAAALAESATVPAVASPIVPNAAATTVPAATGQVPVAPATPASGPAQRPAAVDTSRTITVVGHGEVQSKPDVATASIGIEVLAPTVAAATKQAQGQMDGVIKALKAAGIADKDIQTSNYSINFERQQPGPVAMPGPVKPGASGEVTGTTTVEGNYRVNNMVTVKIRDLSKVGAVLDAAVNAGANNIYGVNFGLENTTALEGQARQKAVADARARAQSLAQLNGVNVGPVVAVSEVFGQPGPKPLMAGAVGIGGGGGTPVEAGELTFSTDIQVVYAIQ